MMDFLIDEGGGEEGQLRIIQKLCPTLNNFGFTRIGLTRILEAKTSAPTATSIQIINNIWQ